MKRALGVGVPDLLLVPIKHDANIRIIFESCKFSSRKVFAVTNSSQSEATKPSGDRKKINYEDWISQIAISNIPVAMKRRGFLVDPTSTPQVPHKYPTSSETMGLFIILSFLFFVDIFEIDTPSLQ